MEQSGSRSRGGNLRTRENVPGIAQTFHKRRGLDSFAQDAKGLVRPSCTMPLPDDGPKQVMLDGLRDSNGPKFAGVHRPDLRIVDQADAVDFRSLGFQTALE